MRFQSEQLEEWSQQPGRGCFQGNGFREGQILDLDAVKVGERTGDTEQAATPTSLDSGSALDSSLALQRCVETLKRGYHGGAGEDTEDEGLSRAFSGGDAGQTGEPEKKRPVR